MRYIKLENNQPINYTIEQLLVDNPNAVIYKNSKMPNEELLSTYNVYPLITEALPNINEDEIAEESTPEFRDGEWHQTWAIRKLTDEEIKEIVSAYNEIPYENSFFTSKDMQEKRYEICKSCDSFTVLKTCRECGCIMALKIKIAEAKCPVDKW
jgi:hypothetical protein